MSDREGTAAQGQSGESGIIPIRMPKWGLSMEEGRIVAWLKRPGQRFSEGEELAEIETSKINNIYEAPASGLLRRILAPEGESVPVGGLIALAAESSVDEAQLDAFIADHQATLTPAEMEEASAVSFSERRVDLGARWINYVEAGAGDIPVVFVHGFSGDLHSWDLNLAAMAEHRRIIAVDLPGHGASTKDVGDGSVEALASVLSRTLDALSIADAHLVGHSLGAAVTLKLAELRAGMVRSLTLVAPAGLPGGGINREFLDGVVDGLRARDLRASLELLFHDPRMASREMAEDMARFKRLDGVEAGLAAIRDYLVCGFSALPPETLRQDYPPTLVVAGESDRIVGRLDAAALPTSWRIVTLPAAGHMPHVEQSREFNSLLASFLAEHS